MDRTVNRPEEELAVGDRRRRQRAVEELRVLTGRLADGLLPEDLVRSGIGGADGVAVGRVQPRPGNERLGALIGPDGMNLGVAEVLHRLVHLGIALGLSEPDADVRMRRRDHDRPSGK